ncbi:hypothetical protein TrVE_jg11787 [Triparma verrucosa]|uniref:RNA helicase n=1 Tax=Triparma verrucosa TaxID=1606542 RepID=A0A9W7C9Y8_9STRA|nr:hypothetical protein TrVE_jg11787 [Triparma verrucosa]
MDDSGNEVPAEIMAQLASLPDSERQQAIASYLAAKRAEERAEMKALERKKKAEREKVKDIKASAADSKSEKKITFVSKKRRLEMKAEEEKAAAEAAKKKPATNNNSNNNKNNSHNNGNMPPPNQSQSHLNNMQIREIRHHYVGRTSEEIEYDEFRKKEKQKKDKRRQFKFQWDADEDTSRDADPLYDASVMRVQLKEKKKIDPLLVQNSVNSKIASRHTVYSKPLTEMTTRDWRIIREDFDIRVRGGKAPNPLRSFEEADPKIHDDVMWAIKNTLKYKDPSPIQRQAIPIGLKRRDMIGIAETGSGKTAAFGIPMVNYVLGLSTQVLESVNDDGPLAIVMAPTRELALQIEEEITKLLSAQSLCKSLAIVGGQDVEQQAFTLRNGVHIVVGTPGRMQDMLDSSYLVLNQCSYIILDEADRMLDMGFEPQMTAILEAMSGIMKSDDEEEAYMQEMKDVEAGMTSGVPKFRLTAMFSATMPAEVERLARTFLRHPAIISVGDQGGSGKNKRIEQRTLFISKAQKEKELAGFTKSLTNNDKVMVFVNEKKHAEHVAKCIEKAGRKTVVLHGGKAQALREESLALFKQGGYVLVATDVAGRGIDVDNVTHVLNYDLPTKIDNYCHRIGRTGRAGKSGIAYNFLTDGDTEIMPALLKYLKETGAFIPDKLEHNKNAKGGGDTDTFYMK